MARKMTLTVCLLAGLAGCDDASKQPAAPVDLSRPDLAGEPFDQVLLRVKQEIGLFQAQSADWHAGVQAELQRQGISPQCGTGDINFNIKSVRMEFSTVTDHMANGEVGLRIPFGPAGGDVGPDLKLRSERKGTNTLDYTYYVPGTAGRLDQDSSRIIADSAVIAPTLSSLRTGLVRATAQLPCMSDTPKDDDDTFAFSVELTRDANPSVGFNFHVVSASAGTDASRVRANTITVTFHPTPTGHQPR